MNGNRIVVSPSAQGHYGEGIVGAGLTFYPGTIVQKDFTVPLQGGRNTYKYYTGIASADGNRPVGAYTLVIENQYLGKTAIDSYAAGSRFMYYQPQEGDELNVLLKDTAGTGDVHNIGEVLMVNNGTGKFIITTGSPQTNPAVLKEQIAAPTADTLAWVEWTGY